MANDYTTSTDAFLDISEGNYSSSDYPAMAGFVRTASRLIDREVGKWDGFFYPTTDSADLYYDGSGEREQEIDEFVSISAVAVAETGGIASTDYTAWVVGTDYITKPYNASSKGRPINRLALVEYQATKGAWYTGQKSVKVTGIPGYSSTPPDVVIIACRMQATRWFMRAKQAYQDTGATLDLGSMSFSRKIELDPDIRQLLHGLKLEFG